MDDLISRQSVLNTFVYFNASERLEIIKKLPSVQSEIIRCRECKYADDMPIADGRYWCNYHNGYFKFCSEAERKEE